MVTRLHDSAVESKAELIDLRTVKSMKKSDAMTHFEWHPPVLQHQVEMHGVGENNSQNQNVVYSYNYDYWLTFTWFYP